MPGSLRNFPHNQGFQQKNNSGFGQDQDYSFRPDFNLYVTGLPLAMTPTAFSNLFGRYGKVTRIKILPIKSDEFSTRAGFVCYATREEADEATAHLDGSNLGGYCIHVRYSKSSQAVNQKNVTHQHPQFRELLSKLEAGPLNDTDANMLVKKQQNHFSERKPQVKLIPNHLNSMGQRENKQQQGFKQHFDDPGSQTDFESYDSTDNNYSSRGTSRTPHRNFKNHSIQNNFTSPPNQKPVMSDTNLKLSPKDSLEKKTKVPGEFSHSPCQICGKMTQNYCSMCSTVHYCSQLCQSKDWPEHSKVCQQLSANNFDMEATNSTKKRDVFRDKTVTTRTAMSELSVKSSKPVSVFPEQRAVSHAAKIRPTISLIPPGVKDNPSFDVLVTDLDAENASLICQIADEKLIASLNQLQVELNTHFTSIKANVLAIPTIGDVCATKFSLDDMWYRAVIKQLSDSDQALIQFVDYGNCEMVHCSQLMQLDKHFCHAPAYSLVCKLAQTNMESWTPHIMETLAKILAKNDMLLQAQYYKEIGGILYAFFMTQDDVSVNQKINALHRVKSIENTTGFEPEKILTGSSPDRQNNLPVKTEVEKPYFIANQTIPDEKLPVRAELEESSVVDHQLKTNDSMPDRTEVEKACVVEQTKVYRFDDITSVDLPASNFDLLVSFIEDPSCFYCQIISEDLLTLQNYLNSLTEHCQSQNQPKEYMFKPGDLCCALFAEDQQWYRAHIIDLTTDDVYKVQYYDFGNTADVPADQIRLLPKDYMDLPVQAFKASLANCFSVNNGSWSKETIEAFKNLLPMMAPLTAKVAFKDEKLQIQLIIYANENETVNEQLVVQNLALEEQAPPPEHTEPDLEKVPQCQKIELNVKEPPQMPETPDHLPFLKVEDKVETTSQKAEHVVQHEDVVSESANVSLELYQPEMDQELKISITCSNEKGTFYCHVVNPLLESLVESINELTLYGMKDPVPLPKKPIKGTYCAAYFEEEQTWYRAIVEKVEKDAIFIKYIDYGNDAQVSFADIKVLPDHFKNLPVMALRCTLANMKPVSDSGWGTDFTDVINICVGKELDAKFIMKHNSQYAIIMPDLVNMLIMNGIGEFCF